MKHARFTPAAVVELEDAARRVDRARPGWGDKLNDEVLEALERIEEYVEGWQTFDERGPERRFVLDRFPCIYQRTDVKDELQAIRSLLDPDDHEHLLLRLDRQMSWKDIARVQGGEDNLTNRAAALRKRFERVKARIRELADGVTQ